MTYHLRSSDAAAYASIAATRPLKPPGRDAAMTPDAAASDAEIRASLIAAGLLRPKATGREPLRSGVYVTDAAGVAEAVRHIVASSLGHVRLAAVIANADPRVAARLREAIAKRTELQLEAA